MLRVLLLALMLGGCAYNGEPPSQSVVAEQVESIDQSSVATVNNQDMPPWMFFTVILLAGWAIPTPSSMFMGVGSAVTGAVRLFRG